MSLSTGYWVLRAAHRLSRYALGIGNSISVLAAPGEREGERVVYTADCLLIFWVAGGRVWYFWSRDVNEPIAARMWNVQYCSSLQTCLEFCFLSHVRFNLTDDGLTIWTFHFNLRLCLGLHLLMQVVYSFKCLQSWNSFLTLSCSVGDDYNSLVHHPRCYYAFNWNLWAYLLSIAMLISNPLLHPPVQCLN